MLAPKGVAAAVDVTTMRALLARAGPALRYLSLEGFINPSNGLGVVERWLVPALEDAACFGLEELWHGVASAQQTRHLQLMFPRLRKGCIMIPINEVVEPGAAEWALTTLPGLQRRLDVAPTDLQQVVAALQGAAQSAALGVLALSISPFDSVLWPHPHPTVQYNLDLDALTAALDAMPALQDFSVCGCHFGPDHSVVAAAARLLSSSSLRTLRLHRCQATMANAVAALAAPRLEVLDLGFSPELRYDDDGGAALAAAVGSHPTLRKLLLHHCDLSAATVASLGAALEASGTLCSLDLSFTPSFRRGAERFWQGFERNTSLQELLLERCALDAAGARAAARAVARQGHLQRLSVAGNELSDDGAMALAALLQHKKCTLRDVSLESNGITGPGGVALGTAIGRNTSLTALNVSENQCGVPAAAKALAAGLAANKTLRVLELAWWSLSGGAFAALGRAAGAHPKLLSLDLSFNDAGDAGARVFAAALERPSCGLRVLMLNDCNVGGSGARALAKALRVNTRLHALMLRGNDDINMGAFNALRQAFRDNTALRALQLGPELPDLDRDAHEGGGEEGEGEDEE
jgi:Ran GTPase-activating protein (RanGAP) involved in mRNA processing and transport